MGARELIYVCQHRRAGEAGRVIGGVLALVIAVLLGVRGRIDIALALAGGSLASRMGWLKASNFWATAAELWPDLAGAIAPDRDDPRS